MSIQVTQTKVILPQRREDVIPRTRLLDLLYGMLDHKLILVSAHAGYGKTSLLLDFAHRVEMPVCWYALDPLDNHLERFLAHFIAAIKACFPAFGSRSQAALDAAIRSGPDINELAATVVNEVYEHAGQDFLLILDDYHLVHKSREVESLVNAFAQQVGENCHLVLSSRELPSLDDLALMIARSQVDGLGQDELAFTTGEIKALMLRNHRIPLSDAEAEELVAQTEGWITGVLLSAQTVGQGMAGQLRVARASGVKLYDYLAQQVLDQQPEQIRDFLLRSSLLEEFDPGLCQSVFGGGQNWSAIIEQVKQRNTFVQPVTADGQWVRYHHLFRDFLQARMTRDFPAERETILRKLVEVYADQGDWDKAYDTCLKLEDQALLVDLVENAGPAMIKAGRLARLEAWIDDLPDGVRIQRPALLSLKGTVRSVQGAIEQGLPLLDQADAILRQRDHSANLAANLVRRADIQRMKGDYRASIDDASEALALTEADPSQRSVYAGALRSMGMGYFQTGDLEEAIQYLSRSLEVYQSLKDRQLVAMVSMELGLAHMNAGQFRTALKFYQGARDYWGEVGDAIREANVLNNLGVLHHLTGQYVQAGRLYEQGLAKARQVGYPRMQAFILCGLADLYADLRAGDQALVAYRQGRGIAQQHDLRFLLLYTALASAEQHRLQGQLEQAGDLITSAERYVSDQDSKYETALWRFGCGKLDLDRGDLSEALENLAQAAGIFDHGGQLVEAARASLHLAWAYLAAGDEPGALSAFEQALGLGEQMESQQFLLNEASRAGEIVNLTQTEPAIAGRARKLLDQAARFQQEIPSIRRRLRPHLKTVPFAPPELSIRALGSAQVETDGEPVVASEWQRQRKVREFFFYMMAHQRSLTKEEIGAVFYPEVSPSELRSRFRNLIFRLRTALGKDTVIYEEDRYHFNRDIDYEYDVETFETKVAEGRGAPSREQKLAAYQQAIDLYRGPYLIDIEGSWVLPERRRLEKMHLDALASVAELHLETKALDQAISYCDRVLAEDRCYERAYRLKMRAYAALGNRAEITRQYELCKMFLERELNASPSPQTEVLYFKLTQ